MTQAELLPPGAPLRERIAQLIFVRIGSNLPPVRTVEEDESRIAGLLQEAPIGGLVLFNGSYGNTPATLRRLQKQSRYPLLICADLERGAGQQLRGYPLFPHAMAFEALGSRAAEAVFDFGKLTGQAARAAGVHINFAPVADVNSDPRNPIISTRAFADKPQRAAELAVVFVRGCQASGLLATAKHFPGHGDTHEDSHHALPTVDASREEMLRRELPPFRAAIEAGVPLVMTAHVRYPALDPTGQAATLSQPILSQLLRRELGFQGAVVSDSLLMEGVKVGCADEGELAVKAVNAGVDILLDVAHPMATLDALEEAIHAGALSEARIEEALARVMRLKNAVFIRQQEWSPINEAENRAQTESLAFDVARRATVLMKNDGRLLPFSAGRQTCAIFINPFPLPSNAEPPPLGALLRRQFRKLDYFELGADPPMDQLNAISRAADVQQLLVAFVVKPAAWHQFGLPAKLRDWLQQLVSQRPAVAACLGAPQGLEPLADAGAHVCTFSDVPVSQQALVEKLLTGA
jgi:beta-glucosidase-like glycosyl hydrolase